MYGSRPFSRSAVAACIAARCDDLGGEKPVKSKRGMEWQRVKNGIIGITLPINATATGGLATTMVRMDGFVPLIVAYSTPNEYRVMTASTDADPMPDLVDSSSEEEEEQQPVALMGGPIDHIHVAERNFGTPPTFNLPVVDDNAHNTKSQGTWLGQQQDYSNNHGDNDQPSQKKKTSKYHQQLRRLFFFCCCCIQKGHHHTAQAAS